MGLTLEFDAHMDIDGGAPGREATRLGDDRCHHSQKAMRYDVHPF